MGAKAPDHKLPMRRCGVLVDCSAPPQPAKEPEAYQPCAREHHRHGLRHNRLAHPERDVKNRMWAVYSVCRSHYVKRGDAR